MSKEDKVRNTVAKAASPKELGARSLAKTKNTSNWMSWLPQISLVDQMNPATSFRPTLEVVLGFECFTDLNR